jgi:hypothetical protein
MQDIDSLLTALQRSSFRKQFRLRKNELIYVQQKGMEIILHHAHDFITKRLSAAQPENDGKQTPYKGHPVFVAQHATATCCRGCLQKWHKLPIGRSLTREEQDYIVEVIGAWLKKQLPRNVPIQQSLI